MSSLTIKNIPDSLHDDLRKRAKENGRSLNGEVIACLRQSISAYRISSIEVLNSIDRVREDGCKLDNDLLKKALQEGRP